MTWWNLGRLTGSGLGRKSRLRIEDSSVARRRGVVLSLRADALFLCTLQGGLLLYPDEQGKVEARRGFGVKKQKVSACERKKCSKEDEGATMERLRMDFMSQLL